MFVQSMRSKASQLLLTVGILLCPILACKHKAPPNALPHSVTLRWEAPTTVSVPPVLLAGYNVYRSTVPGTAYVKIASLVPQPPYEDHLVISGRTYFYVVTSVDQAGRESRFSKEVQARIP
jgi:fibronectin type 3 domain-containing protein